MNISNNTVLITGGASGIGFALAKAFIESGNKVIICGRDKNKLKKAKHLLPGISTFVCDITNKNDLTELQSQISSRFPELNILVNNAGIQVPIDFNYNQVDETLIDVEIDTNFSSQVRLTNRLLPVLSSQKDAAILFVSSALSRVPKASSPVYCATKAAIHSFTQSLRMQMADSNINVIEVVPDLVETDMTLDRKSVKKMQPKALAKTVINKLKYDTDEILVGRTRLLYGLHRFVPAVAIAIINK
jgi:short-subunit dehydrogenase involved in D-alanine esterification of teichoic acids